MGMAGGRLLRLRGQRVWWSIFEPPIIMPANSNGAGVGRAIDTVMHTWQCVRSGNALPRRQ